MRGVMKRSLYDSGDVQPTILEPLPPSKLELLVNNFRQQLFQHFQVAQGVAKSSTAYINEAETGLTCTCFPFALLPGSKEGCFRRTSLPLGSGRATRASFAIVNIHLELILTMLMDFTALASLAYLEPSSLATVN
jgi:hypothetical protein